FKLFRYLKPYWWQVGVLLLATGGQVFATLQIPALMADIINNGIVKEDTGYIWQQGLIMLGIAVVAAGCALVSSYFSARVGANFSRDIRANLYQKVLSLNLADTKEYSTASLINRTTDDINQVQQAIMMMLSVMLLAPMFCIFALVMAIRTAPDMSWIIAVGIVAILLAASLILGFTMPKFKIFQKLVDKITLLTRENLTGLRVIRAFDNERLEKDKFAKTNDEITKLNIFLDKILKLMGPMVNIIFNGTTLLCSWVGISLLTKDFSYLGDMSAFAQYVSFVMMSFLMLSILFVMLPRANVCAGRINEIMNIKSKICWQTETQGIPTKQASIEFKDVDFRYPGAEEKVLDNISFVAQAGESIAFIGSTGSGKSTLINLVPRFYEATSGEILVNGIDIKEYAQNDLMQRIGLVPQKGVLFAGTVKANIKFGAPNATDAEVKAAAKIAQADDFIQKLPGGYAAHIAQGGNNVSGGQKQRLSIARAVCKNPDIFIFDDSFSALDMKTDTKLRAALKPLTNDTIVMIVAQRVSTIKNADQIVVLDSGKMVGKGKHLELLKKCAVYRSIVKSQLSDKEFEKEMRLADA
ncbi:MAG: ABC transporter ATP-binding protein/permease, partial [Candidatus Saccharibacteria bacterium]|nr:ABC transporter ATP-binding protein/permease [Candidatus Saccharibacteria bacterium]